MVLLNYSISIFKLFISISIFTMPVILQGGQGMLSVFVDEHIEILVTDSQGRRTGYDPLTGEIIQEIPATSYGREGIGDDYLENGDQSIPPSNVLYNMDAMDGEYVFQLMNPSGEIDSFSLEVFADPSDVNSAGEVRVIKGVLTPDSTVIVTLKYSKTAEKPIQGITVTKKPIKIVKTKAKKEEE